MSEVEWVKRTGSEREGFWKGRRERAIVTEPRKEGREGVRQLESEGTADRRASETGAELER
jgi:hypothetical protein